MKIFLLTVIDKCPQTCYNDSAGIVPAERKERDMATPHDEIMKELERLSKYAIASKSKHLVYEVYGLLKGLRMVEAISKEDFFKYNTILVRDTMNNGPVWNSFGY